jgi:DME family drug/metabolite transporter
MLWGTSGSVMMVLADRAAASALLVGLARLWIAALLLLGAALVSGVSLAVAPRDRWRCLAMGACMAGYQAAYFPAVTLGGIVIVALITICSAPLLIAALAPLLLGERQSRPVHAALGLGLLGTALLVAAPGAAPPARCSLSLPGSPTRSTCWPPRRASCGPRPFPWPRSRSRSPLFS